MELVALDKIVVSKRQRGSIDPTALTELKNSILERVLLHPPVVVAQPGGAWSLLAGERRFQAISLLAKEGQSFRHGDIVVPPGQIPVTTISEFLSEADIFALELEENTHRVDLTWQEKVTALAALHELRKSENPKQTYRDTAKEVIDGQEQKIHVTTQAQRTQQAIAISRSLNDPAVASARNATEAYNLILRKQDNALKAALARRSLLTSDSDIKTKLIFGDLREVLQKLREESIDLILADPPYGIDAGSVGFRARTEIHHNYDDTPEQARRIALAILTEGFRVAKPRANILLFTDVKHWDWLQNQSSRLGWSPFRRPLIWQKSLSEGLAPWGASGPRITSEFIFYATKGKRGMTSSPCDIIPESRVRRNEKEHAAEKPVNLLKMLIECTTLPGDLVLDPCCGSGSTLVASRELKRHSLGIEIDKHYYDTATARLFGDSLAAE